MNNKFYVILGGAGLIGSHLILDLQSKKIPYLSVDIREPIIKQEFIKLDLSSDLNSDSMQIFDCAKGKDVILVNLASQKIPFIGNRYESCVCNVGILNNFIKIAEYLNADIVYASTNEVYGYSINSPEESNLFGGSPLDRRWSYSVSKLLGEHLAFGYKEKFPDRKFYVMRIFSVAGSYFKLEKPRDAGIVASICHNAIIKKEIVIDCNLNLSRTYMHVKDFINAFNLIIDQKHEGIINVGNKGNYWTVSAVIEIMLKYCGKYNLPTPKIITQSKDVQDVLYKSINSDKLHSLGYKQQLHIDDIVKDIFDYVIEYSK